MVAPIFVLRPASPKYKAVWLNEGARTLGRSRETGITSQSVSREQFRVLVEGNTCKVRSIVKHKYSVLKIDAHPVTDEWIDCPEGAGLELRTATDASYKYTLERYKAEASTSGSATIRSPQSSTHNSGGVAGDVDVRNEEFVKHFMCPYCMDVFFQPTELECPGRHLFCKECIGKFLQTKRCPVCREVIKNSKKAKLTSQAVSVVDEVVKWVIESRMCEYGDETQWRSRAHLEALPPPSASKHTLPQAAPPVQTETSQGARAGGGEAGSRLPFNGVSGNQSVASAYSNSSEVINLMSDSDDD